MKLDGTHIRIRADQVIAEMLQGLGRHVVALQAPFDPAGGAYAGGHHHHEDWRQSKPTRKYFLVHALCI